MLTLKRNFTRATGLAYEEVLLGRCYLVPNEQTLTVFSEDYRKMMGMVYGTYPKFEEIISTLKEYERKLNRKVLESITIEIR